MDCLTTALHCNELGLIPVLIYAGDKRPVGTAWQDRRLTDDEIRRRFTNSPSLNVGVLLGPASGVIDIECDGPESPADLAELFAGCEMPTTPRWSSRRGDHYLFAWDDRLAALGKAVIKWKSVEVRLGTGGKAAQSLLPPSTVDGFTRQWIEPLGTPAKLPELVIERLLRTVEPEKPKPAPTPKHPVDDDFCRTSDFRFLIDHGWKIDGDQFIRPGKTDGVSAGLCTAEDGTRLLHVFSTNAEPFEAKNYNAFDAYALLNHAGDADAARETLAKQGYGRLRIPLITCAELDDGDFNLEYLISDTLVARQPMIVAGPKKALKTSVMIDLALSLATGCPFLGRLPVTRPCIVTMLSGESGAATIQETARRIADSKGHRLAGVRRLFWSTFLPKLDDPLHLDALGRSLQETRSEVLIVDPAYLCLPGADAANLFVQGAMLRRVAEVCEQHGVALVLAHHTRKRGKNSKDHESPELDDISWSGFAEFARQWLLLGRREDYMPGTGEHKLWMNVGGSAGHSALWAVNIHEGIKPRRWEVTLSTPADAREEKKSASLRDRILDVMREFPHGETKTTILETAKLRSNRSAVPVLDALVQEGRLIRETIKKGAGCYEGFRLAL